MIRFLAIVILLTAAGGGGIYYLLSKETVEDVKVTGKLQISEQYGSYVMASQSDGANYYAVVEGKIKNNLKKPIKNIFIKYVIAGQETSATIFDLAPGQEIHFNTSGVATSAKNPEYDFVALYYD
jgi:hypothetical protein